MVLDFFLYFLRGQPEKIMKEFTQTIGADYFKKPLEFYVSIIIREETNNFPELTEGVEVVSVHPKSEVKVNVNSSDTPTTIGYLNSKIVILLKKQ